MEYTSKAEDIIGNSAVSEDDNTNQSQNDYGDDCVDGDCDRKCDDHDCDTKRDEGVMVTPQEMKGVMVQMATVVMLRLLTIMMGLQLMIKLMMAMMAIMMVMVVNCHYIARDYFDHKSKALGAIVIH